jgi:hypothetical protein
MGKTSQHAFACRNTPRGLRSILTGYALDLAHEIINRTGQNPRRPPPPRRRTAPPRIRRPPRQGQRRTGRRQPRPDGPAADVHRLA